EPCQQSSWVESSKQRVKLVGSEKREIRGSHGLAEKGHVDERPDSQVQRQAADDRPPPGRAKPEPESQGKFDHERGVRHEVDERRIMRQPFQVELAEIAVK